MAISAARSRSASSKIINGDAAQLHVGFLQRRPRRVGHHLLAGFHPPVKETLAMPGWSVVLPNFRAAAGHHVEDAVRQASRSMKFPPASSAVSSVTSARLEDHRIARRQRSARTSTARFESQVVPGTDASHHAQRFAAGVDERVSRGGICSPSMAGLGRRNNTNPRSAPVTMSTTGGFRHRFAGIQRFQRRQLIVAFRAEYPPRGAGCSNAPSPSSPPTPSPAGRLATAIDVFSAGGRTSARTSPFAGLMALKVFQRCCLHRRHEYRASASQKRDIGSPGLSSGRRLPRVGSDIRS